MIRDLATGPAKRELFTKLADHYKVLAAEVQRAITNDRLAAPNRNVCRRSALPTWMSRQLCASHGDPFCALH
jgi:hypothetical protein